MKPDGATVSPRRATVRLTRLGIHFGLIATFAVVGGSIRGFNLMLILAAMVFAATIVNWRIAAAAAESISARRRLPFEAVAGRPMTVRYLWSHGGAWTPAWMMRIDDHAELMRDRGGRETSARELGALSNAVLTTSRRIGELSSPLLTGGVVWGQRLAWRSGVGVVPAGANVSSAVEMTIPRRGVYRLDDMVVSSRFPFTLIETRVVSRDPSELSVYPAPVRLRGDWQKRLRQQSGGNRSAEHRSGPDEGEFYGIRPWQSGDSLRQVHWRTTARMQSPAVRQYQRHRRLRAAVVLDMTDPGGSEDAIESAVSLTATFMQSIMASSGNTVSLGLAGSDAVWIGDAGGRTGRRQAMQALAAAQSTETADLGGVLERLARPAERIEEVIVVSVRSREQLFLTEPLMVRGLFPWVRRGRLAWIQLPEDWSRWVDNEPSVASVVKR